MSKEEGYTVTREEEENVCLKGQGIFWKPLNTKQVKAFTTSQLLALNRRCSFLKTKVFAEGVVYPRMHSVRALLEILSDLVPENKKSTVKGILENYLQELGML